MKTGNVFLVDMSNKMHNFSFVSRIVKHEYILAV